MQTLSIDLETYSDQPLAKTGVYRYVESPDFEILLFAYSVDGGSVQQIDLACGEKIPPAILAALEDDKVIKWAFNANFERICLSRFLGYPTGDYLEPDSWRCSMVWAAYMGLPLSLEGAGARSWAGKAKAGRRQRPHQIFLPALCANEVQRSAHPQSPQTRPGQMADI